MFEPTIQRPLQAQPAQDRPRPRRKGLAEDPTSTSPYRRREAPALASSQHAEESTSSIVTPTKAHAPLHDFSFCSDVSVLSSTSAQEASKAWFCLSCSYRNSDTYQRTCALCGCAQYSATAVSPVLATNTAPVIVDSAASVSSGTTTLSLPTTTTTTTTTAAAGAPRRTIFTIDSSISIVSQPSNRSVVSFRSLTSCSRTTCTSHSTKVMSNRTTNTNNYVPASPARQGITITSSSSRMGGGGPLQKPRCEDKEEVGSIQPPTITHALRETGARMVPKTEYDQHEVEDDQEEDTMSLASQDTCRAGSLSSDGGGGASSTSSVESEEEEDDDTLSLYSSSRNKIVPHEDPMEMQPRHHRRRPKQSHQKHQEEILGGFAALSPILPLRRGSSSDEEEDVYVYGEEEEEWKGHNATSPTIMVDPVVEGENPSITNSKKTENKSSSSSKKKKKSIADYIPGLRRRRRNKELRSSDNTAPTLSSSVGSHSRLGGDSPTSESSSNKVAVETLPPPSSNNAAAPSCWEQASCNADDDESSFGNGCVQAQSDWCQAGSVGESGAVLRALTITARYGENCYLASTEVNDDLNPSLFY